MKSFTLEIKEMMCISRLNYHYDPNLPFLGFLGMCGQQTYNNYYEIIPVKFSIYKVKTKLSSKYRVTSKVYYLYFSRNPLVSFKFGNHPCLLLHKHHILCSLHETVDCSPHAGKIKFNGDRIKWSDDETQFLD